MLSDAVMSFLWSLTYTLVLIGTKKYKYPLLSPMTQLIIAPFEVAVVFKLIIDGTLGVEYISISYIYWVIIEVLIFIESVKYGGVSKRYIIPYLLSFAIITSVMCYLVAYRGYYFFFSYFGTFVGEIFWLIYILKKDYPMKPMAIALFLTKFAADALAVPIYLRNGSWLIKLICVALPILDFIFIHAYLSGANNTKKSNYENAS